MAGSVSAYELLVFDYQRGMSLPQVAESYGIPVSTARYHVKKAGVLRDRGDALRLAGKQGRMGQHLLGKSRQFSEEHCANISKGRRAWGDKNAAGTSLKRSGYVEITRGEHKGRSEHVRLMEERLGRRLRPDEVVHHIDRDRSNNDPNNLALMTRAAHTRLHRFEEKLEGIERNRENGRFS